ncbi:hypothetical protein E2562_030486 [Oryza meyeriana var. granulata]|uniref:Uncharacterized protein n=1 Tax=Oryza meyeriana var. granulata TaxID=110450 RepID=A0A6G1CV30_9ORYZ|nr:hypothetical protein E2562_030486 [Oryza meyeriana var. granulata]
MNDSEPIEIDDDDDEDKVEVEDGVGVGSKRKLTSAVCKEFKRVTYMGTVKAKLPYKAAFMRASHLMRITNKKLPFGLVFKT